MDRNVANCEFVDGVTRTVFETPDGRQNVVDDDGEFVFGVWYMPGDISREEWNALIADRLIIVEPDF
jgi:hypothetical protein